MTTAGRALSQSAPDSLGLSVDQNRAKLNYLNGLPVSHSFFPPMLFEGCVVGNLRADVSYR